MFSKSPVLVFINIVVCFIVLSLLSLSPTSYSWVFFSPWHGLESNYVPVMTGNQPALFSEASLTNWLTERLTATLCWHCHYTGDFVPVASLSLLTFCVTLAVLLPIKPFKTPPQNPNPPRQWAWLIELDAAVTCWRTHFSEVLRSFRNITILSVPYHHDQNKRSFFWLLDSFHQLYWNCYQKHMYF